MFAVTYLCIKCICRRKSRRLKMGLPKGKPQERWGAIWLLVCQHCMPFTKQCIPKIRGCFFLIYNISFSFSYNPNGFHKKKIYIYIYIYWISRSLPKILLCSVNFSKLIIFTTFFFQSNLLVFLNASLYSSFSSNHTDCVLLIWLKMSHFNLIFIALMNTLICVSIIIHIPYKQYSN